jgi:hypothetical protein
MKIEIKNLKHSEFASHETNCFEASVYVDGKRIGVVSNDGQGGCNSYSHPHKIWAPIEDYAKTLPPIKYTLIKDGVSTEVDLPIDMDSVIGDLVTDALYARDLKRQMSSRIMFIGEDGAMMETTKMDKGTMANWLSKPELMDKLKATKVLNLMPMADAIKLYRQQGAK